MIKIPQILLTTLCAFIIMPNNMAAACTVCFGDPDSKLTQSMGWGIWVLMGFIGTVLVLFAALFLNIRARMKKLNAAH